ncbi:MAG: DNA-directed RNA polymerase subunit omega [Firmicutes bacterium]|nr:DNA-directed RNA polymerase subunit omega [Bacillota bacterium]
MLNKPNINELMDVVDSKYALVILAAKRARYMIDSNPDLADDETFNPVSAALGELVSGELHWTSAQQPVPSEPEEAEEA